MRVVLAVAVAALVTVACAEMQPMPGGPDAGWDAGWDASWYDGGDAGSSWDGGYDADGGWVPDGGIPLPFDGSFPIPLDGGIVRDGGVIPENMDGGLRP